MNSLYRIICHFPDRSLPLSRRGVPLFLRTFHFLRMLNLLEPCDPRIYDCYLCVLSSRMDFPRIALFHFISESETAIDNLMSLPKNLGTASYDEATYTCRYNNQ